MKLTDLTKLIEAEGQSHANHLYCFNLGYQYAMEKMLRVIRESHPV